MNDEAAERAEQDQTARMCRLIMLYTLRKPNPWCRIEGQGIKGEHMISVNALVMTFTALWSVCIDP